MKILCVEDDALIRQFVIKKCQAYGQAIGCENLKAAQEYLNNEHFDYALIDLNLESDKRLDGLEVLSLCQKHGIKSAILTGHEDKEIIEQAFELGASQYFSKVDLNENIDYLLSSFLKENKRDDYRSLFLKEYITRHEPLISSIEFAIEQSFFHQQNILITGPTGVGKTKIAEIIHNLSNPNGPFVSKNLNEINENLLESELFGHTKGSFTGATQNKKGLLEMANGGTLFLDEIASLPLGIQKKLLKVIEEKTFTPVGGEKVKQVNFHLVTATCENIEEKIATGDLRVDFYFRLKGMEILIPTLAERPHDIVPLIDFAITKSPKKVYFPKEIIDIFLKYSWPGNIRELLEVTNFLIHKSEGVVKIEDLPDFLLEKDQKNSPAAISFLTPTNLSYLREKGLPELIKQIEHEAFRRAREEYGDRINKISRELKISKSVYYRLAEQASQRNPHG